MSFHRKSDFGVIYPDQELQRSHESDGSLSSANSRSVRSASIAVASDTSTGLSFILDMGKEEAMEHSFSLHEDIEKMFDKTPEMTINDLISSGTECLPSERGLSPELPVQTAGERVLEEYDITSHRRSSFPHIHIPLKSLHSHSVKNFATYIDEEEKKGKKKKRRKKKEKKKHPKKPKSMIFPSRSALLSPSIPEVEKEEYSAYSSESEDSSTSEDDDFPTFNVDQVRPAHIVREKENAREDDDETTKLLIDLEDSDDHIDGRLRPFSVELHIDEPGNHEPDVEKGENKHLVVPWILGDDAKSSVDSFKPGLFYIGENVPSEPVEGSDLQDRLAASQAPSEALSDVQSTAVSADSSSIFPHLSDSAPVIVVLNDDEKPLVSTSARQATRQTPAHLYDPTYPHHDDISKVKFLLGEVDTEEADLHRRAEFRTSDDSDDTEQGTAEFSPAESEEQFERSDGETVLPHTEEAKTHKSHKSRHKHKKHHHHHHHHENYKTEDLLRRRQRGSEVHLPDTLKRVPTETEEAITLQTADLEEMASHRMSNLEGFHKHKRKKHKSTVVYTGKTDKMKRKYFTPETKKYDHTPHEVFVELDELNVVDNHEVEWREKARWIKFEEDVEEGAERWGKPHVASLSFHSLLELRKGLEQGSLMLDLEAPDLITIAHRVVDDMVIRDQISSDVKGQVMRTLLTKHKFVGTDTVKSLIRRNKSSMDLFKLEQRHQGEQGSIMKTFSQASFSHVASASNLPSMVQNNSTGHSGGQIGNSNTSNSYHSQRSLSVPNDRSNHVAKTTQRQTSENSKLGGKKEKSKKKQSIGDPGKLEFVKVDVDNNMAMEDGVHIGLVPNEAYKEDPKDARSDLKMSLMRRIPRDAEACTVLVGCVEYLEKPAMAFVRLAERHVMDSLTEVPLPVRFVFILLGPEDANMDYHEVGRSISTLMSNQHFHDIAYKAETRSEILRAINDFLNESIVLPPGDWDQKTLLPVMDMARKRAKIRRKKQKKKEELDALIEKEVKYKIPMDPLKRTGKPFGGLINDVRRRYPHYLSDFTDGFNLQCIMALIFIFFACLCPCIAFGGLYGEKTYGKIGVVETILATSLTNLIFGVFAGQPLILYGATGPVLVFEKHLFYFCKESHIDFLTWRVWIGLWVFIITLVVLAAEGSFIVRYITRFTEEVFAILISLIFINEVIQKLIEIYKEHPLRGKAFYCDNAIDSETIDNVTSALTNISVATVTPLIETLTNSSVLHGDKYSSESHHKEDGYEHGKGHYSENINEPNTALLSTILIFGTFLIAYFLRIFRNSRFLGRSARRALGDFGIFSAIVVMVLFDYLCADTFTQKLHLPDTFTNSDEGISNWFVNPLGDKEPMQVWLMFVAAIPAFLIFLLLFLELQLTQMLLHKNEFKLKKGSGFHLDQFILGLVIFFCALFGLPWMCPATVRSVAHVSALAVMSRTHAPGEKPKLLEVKDQRLTNIVMNILIGTSLLWGQVLRAVPMAVLFGVFLYLGVSAISGVQLFKRFKLLFMPVKHHPGKSYVRRVRTLKMHAFTIIQMVLVAFLWIVKSTLLAIGFPLFVFLMVPLRLKILPKFFTHNELEVLDKEEEDSEDEEDDDPDFYQLAHMPI